MTILMNTVMPHEIKIIFIGQMRHIHEYVGKCTRYKVPMTINNVPAEIVNKVYTHSLQGFAGYIKTNIL